MEAVITEANSSDAPTIANFCQPIYAATYPNKKYHMTPGHFSKAIFNTPDTLNYFAKILTNHDHQRAYLAKHQDQISGCISIERHPDFYEIHGFYVAPNLHGRGIGRKLMRRALNFCTSPLPIRVEVAETSAKTIGIYRRWGFSPAPELGLNLRHWPEWPEGDQNGYIYMQAHLADIQL